MLFAGNTLPGTTEADATTAFANRITVLLFNRSIPKDQQDKKLGDKLWDERNSIFSLAIRALFKLRKKNYVFTRPGESQSYIEAFCAKENSVQLFLKECCELGADLRVFNVELLRAYSDYCRDNGLVELKKGLFYDLLDGIPGVRYKKIRIKGENRWGREGITLKK